MSISKLRKGLSVARSLVSFDRLRRVEALELILSYQMHRLPLATLEAHLQPAPPLTAAHMSEARLYPARDSMLPLLPTGGCCAEVGTWRGDFSRRIASVCRPDDFHLFDIDFGPLQEEPIRAAFEGRLHKHLGDSPANLGRFPAASFDWLYIDGLHTYEGVVRDLAAAHAVLKPGGYLMCNDYTNWDPSSSAPYGVARAVNELILAEDYRIVGLALEPAGFYDILIRKPA
jgi:SAM-dependent methyltransferase